MMSPTTPSSPTAASRSSNEFIEQQLDDRLRRIENEFNADAVFFSGPLVFFVDDFLRPIIERKHAEQPQRNNLVFLVTTDGGYIEPVRRIVDLLRHHYKQIHFVVPNYAYSAGTVLVMSGDAIHMDYYSRLGPIDPQTEKLDGKMVPALGYVEKYNELITKAQRGSITTAEVQVLLNFDQAELHKFEEERELTIALLKDWLVRYKFKNWKRTKTRNRRVTKRMKVQRAAAIATELNKTKKWHTHGYGISKDVLTNDLRLLIDDFGHDANRSILIRDYHELVADYMVRRAVLGVVQVAGTFAPFLYSRGAAPV